MRDFVAGDNPGRCSKSEDNVAGLNLRFAANRNITARPFTRPSASLYALPAYTVEDLLLLGDHRGGCEGVSQFMCSSDSADLRLRRKMPAPRRCDGRL